MTELHEVAGMRTECESVQVPFRKIFGGTKVKIVTDTVSSIDFTAKEAVLSNSRLKYDHIVLGSGAQPDFFGIPGVKEHSFHPVVILRTQCASAVISRTSGRVRQPKAIPPNGKIF